MTAVGVLVPAHPGPPPPPEERPVGRAALALRSEGVTSIFGDSLQRTGDGVVMAGLEAVPGGWRPVRARVDALHDRFPSQRRAAHYQALLAEKGGLPLGNPLGLTLLCRDKARCQRVLEAAGVPLPALETDPARFAARLAEWGAGFLKPRYGALGAGVRRVVPGEELPERLPGVVPGVLEPAILQRAVPPPFGWAGRSLRVLAQRVPGGGWHVGPAALRQSREDFVVNAARGAEIQPAEDVLAPDTLDAVHALTGAVCAALAAQPAGEWAVELGLDLVLDPDGLPHLIEVNSRPNGRMEALAAADPARFGAEHVAACGRPLRYLAAAIA